jgi:hypothetical protein
MKLDKETLLKNRFWVGLILFAPLWLLVLLVLAGSVSGTIEEKRKKVDGALKAFGSMPPPKSPEYFQKLAELEAEVAKHEDAVWKGVWVGQKGLRFWPGSATAPLDRKLADAAFFTPVSYQDRQEFRNGLYESQFKQDGPYGPPLAQQFRDLVQPAYFAGGWAAVVRPPQWKLIPSTEECWLAQEDLWVKYQLLKDLRAALDKAAEFEPVKDGAAAPKGTAVTANFRSANWEVSLILEQGDKERARVSPKSSIKNVNPA